MQPVRIEITPQVVPADNATLNERTGIVERLDNLGHITAADGEVNQEMTTWQATINGVTVPLTAFAVEPAEEDGRVLVSLVVVADTVSIDRSPTAAPAPAQPAKAEKPKRAVWGDPGTPDPRESIPGWAPEPAHDDRIRLSTMTLSGQANGEESIRSRMDRLGPNGDSGQPAEVRS